MTSARRPLPTDIVALVSFDGRVYPNEAKPLDRLGSSERAHPLETALEQWFSFATNKHTWVSVHGATIRGLLSARPRAKKSMWEVEVLIDASDDEAVMRSLFGQLTAGMVKEKAENVFLRLEADSPLVEVARSAGFFRYTEETLYARQAPEEAGQAESGLRKRGTADLLGVYQLYNRTAPANVRSVEGATFKQWQAAQEKWGKRCLEYVEEDDGIITAWLRVAPGTPGRLALLTDARCQKPERILAAGLSRLSRSGTVLSLVPAYNVTVAMLLEQSGFQPSGRYAIMAKRISQPGPELAKEAAKKAVVAG